MSVEVGQKAPEFTLYDSEKKKRSLSEFKGKNVVLAFFPGAFTGACTKEVCAFRDSLSQFNSLNAQVIGISVDPVGALKAFSDQNKLGFPLLTDFNRQVVKQYDIEFPNQGGIEGYTAANRAVFALDKNGVVRYKWLAPTLGTEPNYDEVKQAVSKLPK